MQAGGAGVAALGGAFEAAAVVAVGDDGLPIDPEVRQQHPTAACCLPVCLLAFPTPPHHPPPPPPPPPPNNLLSNTMLSFCSFLPTCPLPRAVQEDVMGGWEAEMFEDLMPQYDDEADETTEYEDFDSPAADY